MIEARVSGIRRIYHRPGLKASSFNQEFNGMTQIESLHQFQDQLMAHTAGRAPDLETKGINVGRVKVGEMIVNPRKAKGIDGVSPHHANDPKSGIVAAAVHCLKHGIPTIATSRLIALKKKNELKSLEDLRLFYIEDLFTKVQGVYLNRRLSQYIPSPQQHGFREHGDTR